jgi:hypothetical protein
MNRVIRVIGSITGFILAPFGLALVSGSLPTNIPSFFLGSIIAVVGFLLFGYCAVFRPDSTFTLEQTKENGRPD